MSGAGERRRKRAGRLDGATRKSEKAYHCRSCGEQCDVLVIAAVGQTARVWKCPIMLGTELMDSAVALALIRSALEATACIVVRISDIDCAD